MADLPQVESKEIMRMAIAWEIAHRAYAGKNMALTEAKEYAKALAEAYNMAYDLISGKKPD